MVTSTEERKRKHAERKEKQREGILESYEWYRARLGVHGLDHVKDAARLVEAEKLDEVAHMLCAIELILQFHTGVHPE